MKQKEYRQKYYKEHRTEIIAKQKIYNDAHKEEIRKKAIEYYYRNRQKRLDYYQANKRKIQNRYRDNIINYGGRNGKKDILNVNKSTYPPNNQCNFCKRQVHYTLRWHHWEIPDDGIWLCSKCHAITEALIRNAIKKGISITEAKPQIISQLTIPLEKN